MFIESSEDLSDPLGMGKESEKKLSKTEKSS